MQANIKKLPMVQQMNIARDVAFGMEYLSTFRGYVHGVRFGIQLQSLVPRPGYEANNSSTPLSSTMLEILKCTVSILLLHAITNYECCVVARHAL